MRQHKWRMKRCYIFNQIVEIMGKRDHICEYYTRNENKNFEHVGHLLWQSRYVSRVSIDKQGDYKHLGEVSAMWRGCEGKDTEDGDVGRLLDILLQRDHGNTMKSRDGLRIF